MYKDLESIVNAEAEIGQRAGEAIIEIAENQIAENKPPEAREALERLMKGGEPRENAIRYIASVLSIEVYNIIIQKKPFDNERYIDNLNALPTLPEELQ